MTGSQLVNNPAFRPIPKMSSSRYAVAASMSMLEPNGLPTVIFGDWESDDGVRYATDEQMSPAKELLTRIRTLEPVTYDYMMDEVPELELDEPPAPAVPSYYLLYPESSAYHPEHPAIDNAEFMGQMDRLTPSDRSRIDVRIQDEAAKVDDISEILDRSFGCKSCGCKGCSKCGHTGYQAATEDDDWGYDIDEFPPELIGDH